MAASQMHFPLFRSAERVRPFLLILALLSLASLLYLLQANQATIATSKIRELEARKERLQRENAQLLLQIAELEALPHIEERARRMGLAPLTEFEYLLPVDCPEDSRSELAVIASEQGGAALPSLAGSRDSASVGPSRWWEEAISQFTSWAKMWPRPAEAR